MKLKFNEIYWGDSMLERIEICYDKIKLIIANDALDKDICLQCVECIGITDIITWDEVIIDNIIIEDVSLKSEPLYVRAEMQYGINSQFYDKAIAGKFIKVTLKMIGGLEFSIICRDTVITDSIE